MASGQRSIRPEDVAVEDVMLGVDRCASELFGRREPVEEGPDFLRYGEDDGGPTLLCRGFIERAQAHGLVAGVAVQTLNDTARLLVARPEVAWPRLRLGQLAVLIRKVEVERLRRRPIRPRLHKLRILRRSLRAVPCR